jgi:hypothetical protein
MRVLRVATTSVQRQTSNAMARSRSSGRLTPSRSSPRNSELGKVSGTSQHGKRSSAPRKPSRTPKKTHVGRKLATGRD